MTELNLDEIRVRVEAASQGPWHSVDCRHQKGGQIRIFGGGDLRANVIRSADNCVADAEFIAHAREDVPALLAEVERLRSELREYGTEVGRLRAADFRVRELLDKRAPEGRVTEVWISPGAVRRALDGEEATR